MFTRNYVPYGSLFHHPTGGVFSWGDLSTTKIKESPMEYIFGFIIQIAGMLLAKLSWSLCDYLLVKPCARFGICTFTQIKRLLTTTSKRRPNGSALKPWYPRLDICGFTKSHISTTWLYWKYQPICVVSLCPVG